MVCLLPVKFYGVGLSLSQVHSSVHTMAIPVVEFSREGYKVRKVFG